MPKQLKYDKILDALQKLLETKELSNISVSEIAQTAEIGKGSIYYYFSSKDAILSVRQASGNKSTAFTESQFERSVETLSNGKVKMTEDKSGFGKGNPLVQATIACH